MELDYKAIGKRIKIARIKKGITQEAVSDMVDISPAHVSNIETGNTKVSLPTLIAVANALSVSIDTLLCDTITASRVIFEQEAKDLFQDCNDQELKILVDVLRATKDTLRKHNTK